MNRFDQLIPSARGTNLHTTIIESGREKSGLILLVHGFKAERTEGGRLTAVAEALAEAGINSITTDFAGCGESEEPFDNYCISNCLQDMETIYQYMLNHYEIDMNRLGMIGYSMGGRLTCLWVQRHPEFRTIGLWAAASYNAYNGADSFLGTSLEKMHREVAEQGYADYYNQFEGNYLHLSGQFFKDMEECRPYDSLVNYQGNVIMVHGTSDDMVDIEVTKRAFENLTTPKNKKLLIIEGANHGFGLWDDHMEQSALLTETTTQFFKENI